MPVAVSAASAIPSLPEPAAQSAAALPAESRLAPQPSTTDSAAAPSPTPTPPVSSVVKPVDASSLQAVTADVVALLKDLSSGNVSQSKADLARLQNDLKSQQSASVTASAASQTPPFDQVLSRVAESLSAANTGRALEELVTYLIQAGHASGNIVNVVV